MNMTENDVKKHLIENFDELTVTENNAKIVLNVELKKWMCCYLWTFFVLCCFWNHCTGSYSITLLIYLLILLLCFGNMT